MLVLNTNSKDWYGWTKGKSVYPRKLMAWLAKLHGITEFHRGSSAPGHKQVVLGSREVVKSGLGVPCQKTCLIHHMMRKWSLIYQSIIEKENKRVKPVRLLAECNIAGYWCKQCSMLLGDIRLLNIVILTNDRICDRAGFLSCLILFCASPNLYMYSLILGMVPTAKIALF